MKTKVSKAPKATKQKVLSRQVTMTKSQTIFVTSPAVTLKIGQSFKRVKDMAEAFGAKVFPRHGFGYIGQNTFQVDVAVWVVNVVKNPYWDNQLIGNTLYEKKIKEKSRTEFLNRIRHDLDYDATQLRLTFAKDKNGLHFIGVFRLSAIDVDNQTVIYKKVADKLQSVYYKRMTKTLTVTIEETIESTEGVIFG